jgi:hypothetical protein
MRLLLLVFCALAVSLASDVVDLSDGAPTMINGGDDSLTQGAINPTGQQDNFAGPKYGLPGYKESHKWEGGEYT